MEKIVNHRLRWYLEKHHLITKFQSGFRQFHSTYDHLINLDTEIQEAFANQQQLVALCFDIEKAYNMVWRHRILKILQMHGIKNSIFNFIKNFLHTRTIQVRIANHLSSPRIIENGVLQGSVLSVSLFLLAINDVMTNLSNPVKRFLFADDFTIICRGRNPLIAQTLLQNGLNHL